MIGNILIIICDEIKRTSISLCVADGGFLF
jgi:hypothetical protein